jgi:hypothetical protein
MADMATIDALKTMVRTHAAVMLQALDALHDGTVGRPVQPETPPAPAQPPVQWDAKLSERGVRYISAPNSVWRLLRGTYREGDAAQGRHHIQIETFDPRVGRVVGVPVRFAWPDGSDTRTTEAKPGEAYALSWPLFAAGHGYSFALDDGPRIVGMGLGTIEHPERGDHVSYEFVFVRGAATAPTPTGAGPGDSHG